MLSSLLAISYSTYKAIQIAIIAICALCALFVIIVVLIQPSNSNGVSALGGRSTDTFYGKNKSKSIESKLKIFTVVCLVLLAVLMVTYFLLELFRDNFVGRV